jgi:hypothetical protein
MNETLPLATPARRRRAERRAAVRRLTDQGYSTREIGDLLGVNQSTIVRDANAADQLGNCNEGNDLRSDTDAFASVPERSPETSDREALDQLAARAHAAVVAALPALGARELVEFHSRAERVASHARRLGDGEAERSCRDLCRRLERAISTIGRQG